MLRPDRRWWASKFDSDHSGRGRRAKARYRQIIPSVSGRQVTDLKTASEVKV